jgi:hypothetical protein
MSLKSRTSPAQSAVAALHRAVGREADAEFVESMPPEIFAAADEMLRASFVLGMAKGMLNAEVATGPSGGAAPPDGAGDCQGISDGGQ